MSKASADVVVLGLGVLGSAVTAAFARAGVRVVGIDQGLPPHTQGSSHGDTRLIRRAYFEDPRYIPLLDEAYAGWDALAERTGRDLLRRVGLLTWGRGGAKFSAMQAAAAAHQIQLKEIALADAADRFPRFHFPDDGQLLFEPGAGYLQVDECLHASLEDARAHGARLLTGHKVKEWRKQGAGFVVETDTETLGCDQLVLAVGAWLAPLLPPKPKPPEIKLWRAPQFWFPAGPSYGADAGMPCFAFDTEAGFFYGFPSTEQRGVKVAAYDPVFRLDDPDTMPTLQYRPEELVEVEAVARHFLPGLGAGLEHTEMCMYACSPDEDFLLGEHPETPGLILCGAASGHAFKFAPALGTAIAQAAIGGELPEAYRFLSWR